MPDGSRPIRVPVPSEFTGLARQFRQQVSDTDEIFHEAAGRLLKPLNARLDRKPTLRPEHILDAVRAWKTTMPRRFQLDEQLVIGKKTFSLIQMRVIASKWSNVDWEPTQHGEIWEPCISVMMVSISTEPGRPLFQALPICAISMHALARRYQRGQGRGEVDIMRDLQPIPTAHPDLLDVPVLHGKWIGKLPERVTDHSAEDRTVSMRAIRTFVED